MTLSKMYTHIRKVSLRHMIWPIFPIIVAAGILILLPFQDMINPIRVSSTEEVIKAVEEGHTYLEVSIPRLIYSGYNHMKDSDVYGEYYYDLVDDSSCVFFFIEPSEEGENKSILSNVSIRVKVIATNGIFDNMLEMFSSVIDWTPEGVASVTKPYILSQLDYSYTTYLVIFLAVCGLLTYGIVLFVYNLIFVIAPWMSPRIIYPKLQYERKLFNINGFVEKVVKEMEQPRICEGNMYITDHFFVNIGKNEICIIPTDKIKFAYEHSTLKSFLGMHLDVTYTLHLKCTKLVRYHVTKLSLEQANLILEYFKENEPDILIGYTNENKELAKTIINRSTGWFKR